MADEPRSRASSKEQDVGVEERRTHGRFAMDIDIHCVLCHAESGVSPQIKLRARDIAPGGMSVLCRNMLHVGHVGAVRLVRGDGEAMIVGVRVLRCKYIGNLVHECGLEFLPQPPHGCAHALQPET